MIIFETDRLRVRSLTPTDLPVFQEMQGNTNVMQFITATPQTQSKSAHDLIEIITRYDVEGNEIWVWAVTIRSSLFVGTCALFKNEAQEFEIAYRLLETYWGQGYGQEITDGLIAYCLDDLRLDSIVAQTAKNNLASVKILDRSRLSFETEIENTEKNWIERHYRYVSMPGRSLLRHA